MVNNKNDDTLKLLKLIQIFSILIMMIIKYNEIKDN